MDQKDYSNNVFVSVGPSKDDVPKGRPEDSITPITFYSEREKGRGERTLSPVKTGDECGEGEGSRLFVKILWVV